MKSGKNFLFANKRRFAVVSGVLLALLAGTFYLYGQNKSEFPNGYDAVEAAPATHKVVFENTLVRVLEVTVPPAGQTIPMHHHRWPSFFLSWDTGGRTPHIRYHLGDGSVVERPSRDMPVHAGAWSVHWMNPEPMHAIEVLENPRSTASAPNGPTDLRIEVKCHP